MILNIFSGGDIGEAARFGERSAEIARELGERQQLAFALNDLWRPYAAFEDLGAARATLEEAQGIWRELGNLPMLGENLASSSQLSRLVGNDDEALALAEEAYRINEDIGNAWGQAYALMGSYAVHLDRGEVDAAMQAMRRAIELAERGGFVPAQAFVRGDLAGVYANLGDPDRAKQLAADAFAVASEQMPMTLPAVMAAKAEIHLLEGELEQALDALDATRIERLPEPIHSLAVIRVVLLRARIASARGVHPKAVPMATPRCHQGGRAMTRRSVEIVGAVHNGIGGLDRGSQDRLRCPALRLQVPGTSLDGSSRRRESASPSRCADRTKG